MLDQRDFDLAGVDPVPAHLHLVILPPEDLEAAVGLQPSDVSRAVRAHLRVGGVGEEHRPGEVRLTPVSRGEVAAPHDDLTGLAGGHRVPGVVAEHDLDTIERVAGRNSPGGQGRVLVDPVRGDAVGFARAVARDEHAVGAKMPAEPLDVLPVEGLAAEPHDPDRREANLRAEARDQMADGGHDRTQDRDLLVIDPARELAEPRASEVEGQQGRTAEQGGQDITETRAKGG
jgi:hypothetical protein